MDPFAAAVWAEPDDDLPRLIYADYLEERGDPRGAFIRTQIEKTQLDDNDSRRRRLEEQEAELIAKFESEWLGELADDLIHYHFHRGFLEVRLDVRRFLRSENPWLDRPTVGGIHLYAPRQMSPELLEVLAQDPRTVRVRSLLLGFEYLRDACARLIAESMYFTSLQLLDLGTNGLTDFGAQALAESPHLANLRHLMVVNNLIGDRGAAALAECAQLSLLDLSNNEITTVGAEALATGSGLLRIESLILTGNRFDGRSRGGRMLRKRFGDRVTW